MAEALDPTLVKAVSDRLEQVKTRVAQVATKSGRGIQQVEIVTVTKRQPIALVRAAYDCGLRIFGENYAEEAVRKIEELSDLPGIQWDMVGHVQSRKVKLLANVVHRVHSVDSEKLARMFNEMRSPELSPLQVLLEVNVSGEASKEGLDGTDTTRWEKFLPLVDQMLELPRLRVTGLMTMPPLQADMEANRVYFRKLRELRDYLNTCRPELKLTELSMGTSSDFAVAIEEGATIIRLGEAILGPRPPRE